ncbi:claudin-10-like [Myxocyprinus asiaticus]|uniref:claudin-10-like n=1 Tax=Myxocyprinus asiaticus TaxID=70543 RepID=UPI0022214CB5|nr:claudin-10-like [Myxocyprinus asiaticus]
MKIRVMQIWGFLMTVLGWIFVACSMAMEGWKVTSIGGQGGNAIIRAAWYWSSLWRACFTDSTNTSNCYDFPVLWSVEGHLQIVRALLMSGMAIGVLGFILSLVGMECTYIGGKDKEKNRSVFIGGFCHVISGILAASGYAVYAHYVSAEFFNPRFDGLKFDLGTPLFLGWTGCAFQITGGVFFLVSVCKIWSQVYNSAPTLIIPGEEGKVLHSSHTNLSMVSELFSKSKVSAISELSSKSESSDVPNVPSKNRRISRTGRSSRSKRTGKSRSSEKSMHSSWSSSLSRSDLNSRKVSSPGATTHPFIKNSYL